MLMAPFGTVLCFFACVNDLKFRFFVLLQVTTKQHFYYILKQILRSYVYYVTMWFL